MLRLYAPVAVALVLIGSLSVWEAFYSDRLTGTSIDAAEFGKRFENVPLKVGSWVGEDRVEEKETLEMAGAVNHVSRTYTNSETGAHVDLWLIVGHARDICRHTPDICYPSHGFSQIGGKVNQVVQPDGEEPATFMTAKFRNDAERGGVYTRVFWAWNANEPDENTWEAPGAETTFFLFSGNPQKIHFGNNTALYKMYFTAAMSGKDEPAGDNIAIQFAKLMIPEINRALFPERYPPADAEEADADEEADVNADEASDATPLGDDPEQTTPHPLPPASVE